MCLSKKRKHNGFTLMEIIVSIAIFAVVAALAIPKYNESIQNTKVKEGQKILQIMYDYQRLHQIESSSFLAGDASIIDDFDLPDTQNYTSFTLTDPGTMDPGSNDFLGTVRSSKGYDLTINGAQGVVCVDGAAPVGTCTSLGF